MGLGARRDGGGGVRRKGAALGFMYCPSKTEDGALMLDRCGAGGAGAARGRELKAGRLGFTYSSPKTES